MKKFVYIPILLLIVLSCLSLCGCFFSVPKEFELGSVAGIAQDQTMKGVPGVQVSVVGTEYTCYTDDTGTFFFGELQPASYTLSFYMNGYQTQQKNITVQKGQSRTIIVEMLPVGATASTGIMPGINTTSVDNLQNQSFNNSTSMNTSGVYMIYVANSGPAPKDQAASTSFSTTSNPSMNGVDTSIAGINTDIAMLYGADPVSEAYNNANKMDPNATQAEIQARMQFSGKKQNNLTLMNTTTRGPVSIVEWSPNVMPLWMDISDNGMLYIADSSNNITIINTANNNAIMSTIPMGGYMVCDIVLGNSGSRLFCALASGGEPAVGVIDTTTNSYLKTITLPRMKDRSIGYPWGIGSHKNGNRVYVTLARDTGGEVVTIDSLNNTVLGSVTVGQMPFGLAVTPDGRKVYVANQNSANVSVIDTAANKVVATVGVGYSPTRVAATPDGAKILVTNKGANSVSIIDTMTNSVLTTLPVGKAPVGVTVSRDGKMAYVANSGSDNVSIINLTNNSVVSNTFPFPGGKPFSVVVK